MFQKLNTFEMTLSHDLHIKFFMKSSPGRPHVTQNCNPTSDKTTEIPKINEQRHQAKTFFPGRKSSSPASLDPIETAKQAFRTPAIRGIQLLTIYVQRSRRLSVIIHNFCRINETGNKRVRPAGRIYNLECIWQMRGRRGVANNWLTVRPLRSWVLLWRGVRNQ